MVTHLSNGTLTVQYPWYAGTLLLVLGGLLLAGGVQWLRGLIKQSGPTLQKVKAGAFTLTGVVLLVASLFMFTYKLTVGPSGVATSFLGHPNGLKWADIRSVSYHHRETRSLKGRKRVEEKIVLKGASGRTVFVGVEGFSDELVREVGEMIAENVPKGALAVEPSEWAQVLAQRPTTEP